MQHYIAIYAVSIKSNPQDAGNPNIPWNCTTLLQSSQSAAAGHLSVPHTHQPRPWVRGVKVSAEFLVGEEGCYHFLWGGYPTHSPNRRHTGSRFRARNGIATTTHHHHKIKSSWGKPKFHRHRKLSWKSKWIYNLDFHFKKIWGKWHPSVSLPPHLCP